jgi:hypothetical protein
VGASSAPTLKLTTVEQLPSTASRISSFELRKKLMGEHELQAEFAAFGEDGADDARTEVLEFVDVQRVRLPHLFRCLLELVDDDGSQNGGVLVPQIGEVEDEGRNPVDYTNYRDC